MKISLHVSTPTNDGYHDPTLVMERVLRAMASYRNMDNVRLVTQQIIDDQGYHIGILTINTEHGNP